MRLSWVSPSRYASPHGRPVRPTQQPSGCSSVPLCERVTRDVGITEICGVWKRGLVSAGGRRFSESRLGEAVAGRATPPPTEHYGCSGRRAVRLLGPQSPTPWRFRLRLVPSLRVPLALVRSSPISTPSSGEPGVHVSSAVAAGCWSPGVERRMEFGDAALLRW